MMMLGFNRKSSCHTLSVHHVMSFTRLHGTGGPQQMLSRCERQALEALSFHNQEPNKLLLGFINYLGSGSDTRK